MKEFDSTLPDTRPLVLKLSEQKNAIEFKNRFEPLKTLGRPTSEKGKKEVMAMDTAFKNILSMALNGGVYSTFPTFVGYGMLSNLAQEALIRAGVETIADDMTRKPIDLYYDEESESDKEKLINDMNSDIKKFKIKEKLNSAMLKDGYFGGCLAYIDVGELDDEEKEEPLVLDKKTFKKDSFRGLKIIEPVNIAPGTYNTTDPTDDHYFKPEWWYIQGKRFHASRFLYFAGNETPLLLKPAYNFFGIPQAQLALDYVANFVKNRESAQELLNKFSLTCFGTDMSQGLQQNGSWNDLIKRMKMFNKLKTNNGTFVYNKETEEMSQINTPLSGVRDIVDMSMNLLTAIWRIPKIRYIGEGDGGLNVSSSEQMRSYYDYILAMQEKVLTEPYTKILQILQLNRGLEPDEKLLFKFPVLWEMNEKERAELNKTLADRAATYIANGVISQEEERRRLSLDRNSGYSDIDVDDVPEPTEQPLQDVENTEQNELNKEAMDMAMAMDDYWITIHPNGEENTGRHLLVKEGETPSEAIERAYGKKDKEQELFGKSELQTKYSKPKLEDFDDKYEREEKYDNEVLEYNKNVSKSQELIDKKIKDILGKNAVVSKDLSAEKRKEFADEKVKTIEATLRKQGLLPEKGKLEYRFVSDFNDENSDLELQITSNLSALKKKEPKGWASGWSNDSALAKDGRWITIGAREKGENGEDDEGRKGRHIYLDDGETPEEAIKDLEKKDDKKEEHKKEEKEEPNTAKEPENKEKKEDSSTMGYKSANKSMKEFVKLKEETDAAHKFLADTLDEYKNKLDELRKNSKEYQEAEYEYKHSKELAKERGVFEWNILRDASHKKSELDQYFSEEAYLSIKGANEARAKINEFYGGSDAWEKGVNEIQSNIKENIARASKENQKLADAITSIENKIPEYKENLDSLWNNYKERDKNTDWATSVLQYGEYVKKAEGVKTKLIEEKEEFAKKVGKALSSSDGQTIGLASSGIKGLEERLKTVFDGVMAKGILKDNEKPKVVKRNCRAHQSGETLTLCGDTDIQTAIHEFMHYVEYKNPVMLANSIAFLKYRTGDEKIKGLKKLTGISYGSSERARPDKFFNAYCGKVYSMTGDYMQATATEIMSMGVQELFTNPAKFRKEDPEYFNFVLANLKGTL